MTHDIWEANLCVCGLSPMHTPVHASVEDTTSYCNACIVSSFFGTNFW